MLLEAIGIGRKAGDSWLFRDVSFSIAAGQRLALVGPSGSGKTLLLRSLALLDPTDTGEIRWHDERVWPADVPRFRSNVAYLQQRPALPEGTVADLLRQPFSLRVHRDKQFDRARILQLLEKLGRSDEFLSMHQRHLSGGEMQLAALLRVIQLDPEVLLLDEPTAALDAQATKVVEELVASWFNQRPDRCATVWVTHDREQAERVSTEAVSILDGRLDENG